MNKRFTLNKELILQLSKFVLVGGSATLVDMVILYIANSLLGIHHLIAATIAFIIATFYNYYLSMRFVFKSRYDGAGKRKEMVIFYTLSVCGLILTIIGLAILVDGLKQPVMLSKIIVGVFVMIFNFVTRKIFLEQAE